MPPSMHLQQSNAASFSNIQNFKGSHMLGQMQTPHSTGRTPYIQAPSSQQLPGRNGSLTQVQHNDASLTTGQAPALANQRPPSSQQLQPLSQSPSQLAQMLSHQKQTLQATFQSSQQALNQLQQQLHQLQPANQNLAAHSKQQV